MFRWVFVVFCIVGLLFVVVLFRGTTFRSMGYTYPITVQVPPSVTVKTVSYYCMFKREQTEFVVNNLSDFSDSFETVPSLQFDARVRGHRNTSWFGLIENKARESVILIRVESEDGDIFMGLSDIPGEEVPVTVVVKPL